MYRNTWKSLLSVHASNIPGWCTNRKIVVIESDDWGSIRMSSLEAFKKLLKAGTAIIIIYMIHWKVIVTWSVCLKRYLILKIRMGRHR